MARLTHRCTAVVKDRGVLCGESAKLRVYELRGGHEAKAWPGIFT